MGEVENLTTFEKDQLLRKFLHHLEPELRGKIMAEMPVVYVKLFPKTRNVVLRKVMEATR